MQDAQRKILEYVKKSGSINTFRLARDLGIERHILLSMLKGLENKQAIEHKTGNVRFLKFPEEKKMAKDTHVKNASSAIKQKTTAIRKIEVPKIITRTRTIVKRIPVKVKVIPDETKQYLAKLEKKVKDLQTKLRAKPMIVTRTRKIEVPKIITRTIIKRIIKKVPVEVIKEVPAQKKEVEAIRKDIQQPKINLPHLNLPALKDIQQLRKPEFIEQKISAGKPRINLPKLNFARLNKNIQQLHVPSILRSK